MFFRRDEDQNQLQLVEHDEMDDDEDLFEAIDKCMLYNISVFYLAQL